MLRKFAWLGVIAPVIYLLHVVLGGALWQGYSHIHQAISDLSGSGAPDRVLIQGILYVYGASVLLFAVVGILYFRRVQVRSIHVSMICFAFGMAVSFLYGFFPVDLQGAQMTFLGIMHIVVTAVLVPLTILTPLIAGLAFRKIEAFKAFALYSFITAGIIFFIGGFSAFLAATGSDYFGLFERINIGSFELWIFLIACKMTRTDLQSVPAVSA